MDENGRKKLNPEILGVEEIEKTFNHIGIWFYIMQSEYFDTVTVEMDSDPTKAIEELRKAHTVAIKRAIPLDSIVSSPPELVINTIQKLVQVKVAKNESFTVKCKLRDNGHTLNGKENMNSTDLLSSQIARILCCELNLEHDDRDYDWIVQIEELGDTTGIAVCRWEDVLIKN
ncbi:MAG: THUMP domain-containing protein [Methanobacterium sp.]|nr:THUMP domain-containing protein [Methanobacterium sp.]